jgi:hypothetical protein
MCGNIPCLILLDIFRRAVKWDLLLSISFSRNVTLEFKFRFYIRKPHEIAGNIWIKYFTLLRHVADRLLYIIFHDATAHYGPGPPYYRGFTSHSDKSHSAGLLWTSDQPDAETSTWQGITLTRDRHLFSRVRLCERSQTHALDGTATRIVEYLQHPYLISRCALFTRDVWRHFLYVKPAIRASSSAIQYIELLVSSVVMVTIMKLQVIRHGYSSLLEYNLRTPFLCDMIKYHWVIASRRFEGTYWFSFQGYRDLGALGPSKRRKYVPSKPWEFITQWRDVVSQKNGVHNHTGVRTPRTLQSQIYHPKWLSR